MQSWSAEIHNFISYLIGQFDLRHQFWEFVLLFNPSLMIIKLNYFRIITHQISITMINHPIKIVLFFNYYYFHCKKENSIIKYQRTQGTYNQFSIQSFRHKPYINPCPCFSGLRICLPLVSEPGIIMMTENQNWGSELSLVTQKFNLKRALVICADSKINHFPAPLCWPNLQSWAIASVTQPRTLTSALHTHLLCWGSDTNPG